MSSLPFSAAEVKNIRITNDARPIIIFDHIGLEKDGYVSLRVQNVSLNSKHPTSAASSALDPSLMGFFLSNDSSFSHILNQFRYRRMSCLLSSKDVKTIFTFDKLLNGSHYNVTMKINDRGEHTLAFQNCQSELYVVSMTVHSLMYYAVGKGAFFRTYNIGVFRVYVLFLFIYIVFLAIWIFLCVKNRIYVEKIHVVMSALLLFKALNLICAFLESALIMITGNAHGFDKAVYVFGFFKGVMLFIVIVLIGSGWSIIKPFLQDREKKVLIVAIPLQVLANMADIVIDQTDPASMDTAALYLLLILLDIICCTAVIVPITWSIRHLKEAAILEGKMAKSCEMLARFKRFYIIVVGYLYFTKVAVLIIGYLVGLTHQWIPTALGEGASLWFFCFIFHNFKPMDKNPYLAIDDEDESESGDEIVREDEPFEL